MNKQVFINSVNSLKSITPAEKLIIEYFIKNYTMLPFAKMDELCQQIGVGKATLGRFLNRLEFDGFIDFKKCVSEDLVQELTTPIDRCVKSNIQSPYAELIKTHNQEMISNLESTYQMLQSDDFSLAIQYLLNPQGKLYIMGSASAEALANYFYLLARYLRKDVILLKADPSTLPHQLVDVEPDDTLFALSYHRFSNITVRTVRWFKQNGGKIILLTDQQVNPFVAYSDIQFTAESHSEGLFNNRTAGFSIIELLIKGMSITNDKDKRFRRIEDTFNDFHIFKES
ncbi:MurR/RpiR family transcriptional regulator [Vibrio mimicus]|uniref:MurR/RpiR family transcriptional regulator n=1 Tax=Vibrio mimicus TaxID=674 RepID=UPI00087856DA|nr:MurR/RpiR family transcriptional regulator [Vibrio mimicus]AOW83976.1 transcriptional regulator [Vibrio mimicus]TXZ09325.1 MurR/RpiR family transcriptional regulator [Vibrio mimicus]